MLSSMQDHHSIEKPCVLDEKIKSYEERIKRNECDDMKEAIQALYDLKKKLDQLHPNCIHTIEHMLQKNKY